MVTTGFWLSSLFICCLYALQAYVFKGKQQNSCVFINCSERDKCKGESTKPQSKRSNFHWPQWQNPGSLQQNWASQDVLKLISEGFFLHVLKDVTRAPVPSTALTGKVLLIFESEPSTPPAWMSPSNSLCTLQCSLFTVTWDKIHILKLH